MLVTHYTTEKDGEWKRWYLGEPTNIKRVSPEAVELWGDTGFSMYVHALRFDDGKTWDAVNGDRRIITLH